MKKQLLLLFAMLTVGFSAVAGGPCLPFVFTFTTDSATCSSSNGAATVFTISGTAPYTYLWDAAAGAQTTPTAINIAVGTYSVIVTDALGCADTGAVTVYPLVETPSICMVTTNSNSTYNYVYWDKTPYTNVDSFIVYREVAAGSYARIGAVSNDSLSEFLDTARSIGPANGDPNLGSYRYKMQILDTCGNYGAMSLYHNTIYITDEGAGEFSWSIPYTIEGMPNPVGNYILLCDTANVDVWGPVATVPGTDTIAIDPTFAAHSSIANWRVKTGWPIACTPTRATVNTSRSNIKHASVSAGLSQALQLSDNVLIYPNPATTTLTISLAPNLKEAKLVIVDMLGQSVYAGTVSSTSAKQLDISAYSNGMYTVIIENNGIKTYKKLVVN